MAVHYARWIAWLRVERVDEKAGRTMGSLPSRQVHNSFFACAKKQLAERTMIAIARQARKTSRLFCACLLATPGTEPNVVPPGSLNDFRNATISLPPSSPVHARFVSPKTSPLSPHTSAVSHRCTADLSDRAGKSDTPRISLTYAATRVGLGT